MPRVSVITPVFNVARFLSAAAESVVAQTRGNWELILADDGSNDGSYELCLTLAQRHPDRIRVVHHPRRTNRGLGATRNLALEHAAGEYAAFLDPDDVWLPHKLERQLQVLDSHPETGMIFSQAVCVDERTQPITEPASVYALSGIVGWGADVSRDDAYEALVRRLWYAPVATVMVRTDILRELGGFPVGMKHLSEDAVTWARVARRASVRFVPEPLALYRMHSSNWSSRQTPLSMLDSQFEYLWRITTCEGVDRPLARAFLRLGRDYLQQPGLSLRTRLARMCSLVGRLFTQPAFLSETVDLSRRRLTRRPAAA